MMWMLFVLRGAEALTSVSTPSVTPSSSSTTQPSSTLTPIPAATSSSSSTQSTTSLTPSSVSSNVSSSMKSSSSSSSSSVPATSAPEASSTVPSAASPSATRSTPVLLYATATAMQTSSVAPSKPITTHVQPSATSNISLPTSSSVVPSEPITTHATVQPSATSNISLPTSSSVVPSEPITTHATVQPSATSNISLPTSSVSPTGKPVPQSGGEAVYIKMTFKMPWGRLCFLLPLFKQALSDDLIEFKTMQHGDIKYLTYEKVKPARIKLMNVNEKCKNKTFYNDEAVLKFYISNNTEGLPFNETGFIDADKDMTIKAFRILYGYWVEKVELIGADEEDYVDEYTEIQRIGIGIGVGLAVVVLIILIYFCVRGYRDVKSVGRTSEDKRMIFTNTAAINEEASKDAEDTRNADESQTDERYEVVVHTQPLAQAPDEMPLLSAVKDYEDGRKGDPNAGSAPLAKPEPDTVSEGEPIKPPDEFKGEPIRSPDEPEGEPIKSPNEHEYESIKSPDEPEAVPAPEEAPPVSEPPATEPDETFTSSVTIIITPETSPTTMEFPAAYVPPEPAKESDDVKPDLGQSDNVDVDPTQGAINLAFDDEYVTLAEGKDKEDEEETKF
ncbi:hypothetical protein ACROYT_G000615 [Oculina patagonica]